MSYNLISTVAAAAKSLQSCLTLCVPIDGSPPGPPFPGTLQVRTLEWVAISFSDEWKWKVKVKSLSRVRLLATPWTAAYQASPSMGFSRQEYWSRLPLSAWPKAQLLQNRALGLINFNFIFYCPIWILMRKQTNLCIPCHHFKHHLSIINSFTQQLLFSVFHAHGIVLETTGYKEKSHMDLSLKDVIHSFNILNVYCFWLLDSGKDWGQEEKGITENETLG